MFALTHSIGRQFSPTQRNSCLRGSWPERTLAPFSLISRSHAEDLRYSDGDCRQTIRALPYVTVRRNTRRRSTNTLIGAITRRFELIRVSFFVNADHAGKFRRDPGCRQIAVGPSQQSTGGQLPDLGSLTANLSFVSALESETVFDWFRCHSTPERRSPLTKGKSACPFGSQASPQ
jgi:hypothetical protein